MLVVGIDENGYGPRLGPLVVTGSLWRVEDLRFLHQPNPLPESKKVFSCGDSKKMGTGEGIVLALFRWLKGYTPSHTLQFLSSLLLPSQEKCSFSKDMCWPEFPLPHWNDGLSSKEEEEVGEMLEHFLSFQGYLMEVKSVLLCPRQFNEKRSELGNKAHVNFYLFEEVIRYFKEKYQGTLPLEDGFLFLCHQIGTTRDYRPFFRYLQNFEVVEEEREEGQAPFGPGGVSRYVLSDLGEVWFIQDGDQNCLPIALSSLFGKYIRELFVERINNFFREHVPDLPYASGYGDSKTKAFIEATENVREALGIPQQCFLREA